MHSLKSEALHLKCCSLWFHAQPTQNVTLKTLNILEIYFLNSYLNHILAKVRLAYNATNLKSHKNSTIVEFSKDLDNTGLKGITNLGYKLDYFFTSIFIT